MNKLAIVGVSCVFPGATSPEQFFANLLAGEDHRSEGTAQDFMIDPDKSGAWGDEWHSITSRVGGFVRDMHFDLDGFRLPADYLAGLDRSFQWALHVAREALADAGLALDHLVGERTGLVLGNYSFPTVSSGLRALPLWRAGVTTGLRRAGVLPADGQELPRPTTDPINLSAFGFPARVVSEALGLRGPQFAVDAACSSALYSMKLAGDYLYSGRADLMLAGAVCAPDPALIHLSFSDLDAYPDNGINQPFDRRSTGIVTGQGAGLFAIKRLADAYADGDRIYAVVEGIGLSNDGGGRHLLSPNIEGQLRSYDFAYRLAELDPTSVDYIECHATGTPLGDTTEVKGLARFFGSAGAHPAIGSVKANLGHLLTVAGFSSVLKLIMAMHQGILPRTPGVEDAIDQLSEFEVLSENRDWPDTDRPRRAAASAFGFGGTNAHIVLSSPTESMDEAASDVRAVSPALITGMGCHIGPLVDRDTFERHIFGGLTARRDVPAHRWFGLGEAAEVTEDSQPAGAYCDAVEIDPLSYRIPPSELTDFNTQHLLMLSVADEALADAGYGLPSEQDSETTSSRRVAVVIAMEMEPHAHGHRARLDIGEHVRAECRRANLDLSEERMARLEDAVRNAVHAPIGAGQVTSYIGNIMASRISSRYDFSGPSFTVAADGAGSAAAIDVGSLLLSDPSIDAVLVGAVDLIGGVVAAAARQDSDDELRAVGEGAAAIVMTREDQSQRRAYARLDALALGYPSDSASVAERVDERTVASVASTALAAADRRADAVGLLEIHGIPGGQDPELRGLGQTYAAEVPAIAVTSLYPLLGDTQNLAGLLGVMKVALAVYKGTVPPAGLPEREGTALLNESAPQAFWAAPESRPWLRTQRSAPRIAAVSMTGNGGSHGHAVVAEYAAVQPQLRPAEVRWASSGYLIAPVSAPNADSLIGALGAVREELETGSRAETVVRRLLDEHHPQNVTVTLVAADADRLMRELNGAIRDLPATIADGRDWVSPAGSFCTPSPLARFGGTKTALVFPGAFSTYPGAAHDLFALIPGLVTGFEQSTELPAQKFQVDSLYPRGRTVPTRRELMEAEAGLLDDIPTILVAGTNLATLNTKLLRSALELKVDGALGYSLGESSMLYALGIWEASGRDDQSLRESPLFQNLLRGRKDTVRRAWDLDESVVDKDVWTSLLVLGDVEEMIRELPQYDHVFLTHINSPTESVIAGSPEQCASLLDRLGFKSARTPTRHVMHCELVRPHFDELAELNSHPVNHADEFELFSAYDYDRVGPVGGDELSHRIAKTLCDTIDFPRLVRAAYNRDFRIFIEVGPSATCTRWVDEILDGQPHLAVALDRRGMSAAAGIARTLAPLISHGVEIALPALAPARQASTSKMTVTVECGGESIVDRVETMAKAAFEESGLPDQDDSDDSEARPDAVVVGADSQHSANGHSHSGLAFQGTAFIPQTLAPAAVSAKAAENEVQPAAVPTAHVEVQDEPNIVESTRQPSDSTPANAEVRTMVADGANPTTGQLKTLVNKELGQTLLAAHKAAVETQTVLAHRAVDLIGDGGGRPDTGDQPPAADAAPQPGAVWGREQLVEFATGSIANAFGQSFSEIDRMPHRVRLPAPPYLFVDRVVDINAETGKFEPSTISTEFDIPKDAWFSVDGLAPPAVTIEAGQCDMLLISYLGIDLRNRGERYYRLLDSTLVFHGDLPEGGQTLRYDITIDRFSWNGDMLLFFFKYRCYADGQLILELENASAGFFTQEELDHGRGAVEAPGGEPLAQKFFKPLARTAINRVGPEQLAALAAGARAAVFGEGHAQPAGTNPSLRLPVDRLRLIDEITRIDRTGGSRGLGQITAMTYLDPEGWYFACHFVDDPVLAGSMIAEGAVQVLQTYALYLGMHLCLPDARFQSVIGLRTDVKVRGQVTPATPSIRYEVDIDALTLVPRPTVIAHITVYDADKPIVSMRNFGVQLREKKGTPHRAGPGGVPGFLGRTTADGRPVMINEMHLAHAATGDLGVAMGPEFDIYQDLQAPHIPNGDFQFVDRIVEMTGERNDIKGAETMVTQYDAPEDAWYFEETFAHAMPNCVVMETSLQAAILLGYYLGATLQTPEQSYRIRNLDGHARWVRDIDLRGQTIEHRTTLLDSSNMPEAILQRFRYELCADGEPFYVGESLFGYFTAQALEDQAGLDSEPVMPWIDGDGRADRAMSVTADKYRNSLLVDLRPNATEHLRLLDEARIVLDGGDHDRGYVYGFRRIDADDWYFNCHFYRDPVMPGSLGIEAIIQALQLFILESGSASHLREPVFHCPIDVEMTWKYRGQVLREDGEISLEVHVKEVRSSPEKVVAIADASLWKPGMRIYETNDVAIEVREGQPR